MVWPTLGSRTAKEQEQEHLILSYFSVKLHQYVKA